MAFMARALSLAGLLTTVTAVEYKEVATPASGETSSTCAQLATAGEWQNPTEAECRQYVAGVEGATFDETGDGGSANLPCGCTAGNVPMNTYFYKPCGAGVSTTSPEYHHICIKTVSCKTMTCLERFVYWCQQSNVGFGSNNNEAPANSPKDVLVEECPDCNGAANTDTCPTRTLAQPLTLAAPEAESTSELDKTSVAVSVPLGLVSALVAMGAVVGISRSRASDQPVLVEDEHDLLRE
ncbi:unnamed protein product [Prorocentrum cordatum]|uniref:Uncharacterized protein n=1 Tax=Prorocentrum cordatum TaxID=2364126 RepID=A0ABN9X091_9DINO|nr:unnamed protein product [Polarella glacialis]